jgi:hypothetical protein
MKNVVQQSMPKLTTSAPTTRKAVGPRRVHRSTARTTMGFAERHTEAKAYSHPDGFVIQAKPTCRDRAGSEPVTRMGGLSSEDSGKLYHVRRVA